MALLQYKTEDLSQCADEIRAHFCGNGFDMCSITNGKSGKCQEDCKYCAQSVYYPTQVETYDLLDKEEFLKVATENKEEGVMRYSIVTSGRKLSKKELDKVCEAYSYIRENCSIRLCASHGLLTEEELRRLKENGVTRYHNNLETSRKYFPNICTTHTYEDKVATIKAAQNIGLEVCSGGLFGLGETMEDRIDMAFELRELGIESIPINSLVPISGTPMEDKENLTEDEILKTIAIYRFIHPKANIRLAGGRNSLTNFGEKAFRGGANATISGNLLTTCGNTIQEDHVLIKSCGFEIKKECSK